MRNRSRWGFTLVELLIVVAIIGVLAVIAIPNLLTAIQKSRQKRTMADIRAIALAWEARKTDTGAYNLAGYSVLPVLVEVSDLTPALVPTYIRAFPQLDGWGEPFELRTEVAWGGEAGSATRYQIRSPGSDKAYDLSIPPGATTHVDCDIVYENGVFLVFPDGVQAVN